MSKIKLTCNFCGKDVYKFPSEIRSENNYCNRECWKNYNQTLKETRNCYFCNKEVIRNKTKFTKGKTFCTRKCKDEWQKEGLKGENGNFYGKKHTQEAIEKNRQHKLQHGLRGRDHPRFNTTNVECNVCGKITPKTPYLVKRSKYNYCSKECRHIGQSDVMSGTNNANYNYFLTEEDRERDRGRNLGYTKFRSDVKRRDGHKCVICKRDERLVVHHLNSHHWDKANRTNPENAVTLCSKCHYKFHKIYGYKFNTKEQFNEYHQASIK